MPGWQVYDPVTGEQRAWRAPTEEALESRGFARDRTNTTRLYRGLGLREPVTGDGSDS